MKEAKLENEVVAHLYEQTSLISSSFRYRSIDKLIALLTAFLKLTDFLLDYYNGVLAFNGSNLSDAEKSLYWAVLFNVIITPPIAALMYRNETIENYLSKNIGKRLAKFIYILFALIFVLIEEAVITYKGFERSKVISKLSASPKTIHIGKLAIRLPINNIVKEKNFYSLRLGLFSETLPALYHD